jgi:hypothetical protein
VTSVQNPTPNRQFAFRSKLVGYASQIQLELEDFWKRRGHKAGHEEIFRYAHHDLMIGDETIWALAGAMTR